MQDRGDSAYLVAAVVSMLSTSVTALTAYHLFGLLAGGATAILMMAYLVSRRLEAFTHPRELFLLPVVCLVLELSVTNLEHSANWVVLSLPLARLLALGQALLAGVVEALLLLWQRRSLVLVVLVGLAMSIAPAPFGRLVFFVAGIMWTLYGAALATGQRHELPMLIQSWVTSLRPAQRQNSKTAPAPELNDFGMSWLEPILWSTLPLAILAVTGSILVLSSVVENWGLVLSQVGGNAVLLAIAAGSLFMIGPFDGSRESQRPAQFLLLLPAGTVLAGLAVSAGWLRLTEVAGPANLSIFDSLALVVMIGALLAVAVSELGYWRGVAWPNPGDVALRLWGADDSRTFELRHRGAITTYLRQRSSREESVLVCGISGFPVLQAGRKVARWDELSIAAPAIIFASAAETADAKGERRSIHEQVSQATGLPYRLEHTLDDLSIYRLCTRSREAAVSLSAAARAAQDGRHAEALTAFEQTRRCDPWCSEAHLGLGRCLFQLGRISEAVEALAMIAEQVPGSILAAEAQYLRGVGMVNLGELEAAHHELEAAHRILPVQAEILQALGQLERDAGEFTQAAGRYERIIKIVNISTEQQHQARLAAAKCYLEAGQWERTLAVVQVGQGDSTAPREEGPVVAGIVAECERMLANDASLAE